MTVDPKSYEFAHDFAQTIVKGAMMNFTLYGGVHPISFVLAQRDPRTRQVLSYPTVTVLPLDLSDKDRAREAQAALIERTDAVAHVFVSEAWTIDTDPAMLYEDLSRSLSEHPRRVEAIVVTLEHASGQGTSWEAIITRDAEGRGTLGEAVEKSVLNIGRMSGYFKATRHTVVQA